jgi:hypothetical protein
MLGDALKQCGAAGHIDRNLVGVFAKFHGVLPLGPRWARIGRTGGMLIKVFIIIVLSEN